MATISQPPSLNQSANSRNYLVVTPNSRISCFLPHRKQATMSFCTHQYRTLVVNFIHTGTSKVKFTAWYSVCYHFTIRPSA